MRYPNLRGDIDTSGHLIPSLVAMPKGPAQRAGPFSRRSAEDTRSNMQLELMIVVIAKALAELAGMFLLGRGLLYLLAGAKRDTNLFYQVLSIVTNPVLRATRWITPNVVVDRHIPYVALRAGGVGVDCHRVLDPAGHVRLGQVRLHAASGAEARRVAAAGVSLPNSTSLATSLPCASFSRMTVTR